MADPFLHPVFKDACGDIEALGVRVSPGKIVGGTPYAVISGRSNARWWLIPLENDRVAASGLALFQPLLFGARIIKAAASSLSALGLSGWWARERVYIAGENALSEFFPAVAAPSYAYFTGTDCAHRKVTVQVMDCHGQLHGFVKLTTNPRLRALLAHEATILDRLSGLDLRTASVPGVLFHGERGAATLLATDTRKSARTRSTTRFAAPHRAFLAELASKTADTGGTSTRQIASNFRARFERFAPALSPLWRRCLDDAIRSLAERPESRLATGLVHGDFTPWNTFMADGRLYVFDWEYAEAKRPASNDLIHFVLNQPRVRRLPAEARLATLHGCLAGAWQAVPRAQIPALLDIYLLTLSTRQIERQPVLAREHPLGDDTQALLGLFRQRPRMA